MLIKKSAFFLIASTLLLLSFPSLVRADSIDIQSGNTRTIVDEDGQVYIIQNGRNQRVNASSKRNPNSGYPTQGIYTDSYGRECYEDSYIYQSDRSTSSNNGNTVYSQSSTTVCQ